MMRFDEPDYDDDWPIDSRLRFNRMWSINPRRAALVEICMRLDARMCTGEGCDEGHRCPRHARVPAVAERYLRLKERKAS